MSPIGGALGLRAGKVAKVMADELRRAIGREGRVLAIGDSLGKALAADGLRVISVAPSARRRKKGPAIVVAKSDRLPFADRSLDAVCAAGMPEDGPTALRELARVVRDGGFIALATVASALVRRVAPPEVVAASMLHAMVRDVEQKLVGSTLVTCARVRDWGAA
jgi:hypothetical protein